MFYCIDNITYNYTYDLDQITLYSYVGNNPVMYGDPMGLEKLLMQKYDVTNYILIYFNIGGQTLEDIKNNVGYSHVMLYLLSNIGDNPEYNLKSNKILLEKSFDNGYVYVGGYKYHLSDLGNSLYGYVGQKGGVDLNILNNDAYFVNLNKEFKRSKGFFADNPFINNDENEKEDRTWYKKGYELGKDTKTGELTVDLLTKYLNETRN